MKIRGMHDNHAPFSRFQISGSLRAAVNGRCSRTFLRFKLLELRTRASAINRADDEFRSLTKGPADRIRRMETANRDRCAVAGSLPPNAAVRVLIYVRPFAHTGLSRRAATA